MSFELRLSTSSVRFYQRADAALARRLNRCFETLERDPLGAPGIRALRGKLRGDYRIRVGDWRVVYQVDTTRSVVTVVLIAHRSEAYD